MMDIKRILKDHSDLIERINSDSSLHSSIQQAVKICVTALQSGNKILLCGNGGSASDANHIAAELSGRFYLERDAYPAISLNSNTAHITAVSNDYGYDQLYRRGVEAFGNKGDVLIGLSTSGKSQNILNAFHKAKEKEILSIGFCGSHTASMGPLCQLILSVPSSDTPRIQEMHIVFGHILCELVEKEMEEKSTI